jgi:hypothetical protein
VEHRNENRGPLQVAASSGCLKAAPKYIYIYMPIMYVLPPTQNKRRYIIRVGQAFLNWIRFVEYGSTCLRKAVYISSDQPKDSSSTG